MAEQEKQLRGKKYSGDLYGRKRGSDDPFRKIGNVTELTTTRNVENDVLPSTGRDDWGEAIESVSSPEETNVSIVFNTYDKQSFGMILMGEVKSLDTTVKSVIDHEVVARFGSFDKLPRGDIDTTTVVLETTASTPVTLDAKHYVINKNVGMIALRESAKIEYSINEGDKLKISYDTKGTPGIQVDINTLSSYDLEMYLDGRDRITNKLGILDMPHASLSAKDGLNWMANEWWESGVEGPLIKTEDLDADGKPKPVARFTEYEAQ